MMPSHVMNVEQWIFDTYARYAPWYNMLTAGYAVQTS